MKPTVEFNTQEAFELGNLIKIDWQKVSLQKFQDALNEHVKYLQTKPNPQESDTDPRNVALAALTQIQ